MTLIIKKPTGAKLVMRQTWQPMDPDAAAYITAVEAADTAAGSPGGLEERTKIAIDNFVLGCKADGIWNAIKASCILAGARTLNGALVPLVGTAPTSFNFVAGDYNRKTGLVGNGSTKYLDTNRSNTADPKANAHFSCYGTTFTPFNLARLMGSETVWGQYGKSISFATTGASFFGAINSGVDSMGRYPVSGFVGMSRNSSTVITSRNNKITASISRATANYYNPGNVFVFAANGSAGLECVTSSRLAFYSIGEALDLALLDARVTDLINAFGAAIP